MTTDEAVGALENMQYGLGRIILLYLLCPDVVIKFSKDDYKIVFCTGRRESVRFKTVVWIQKNCFSEFDLLMRPDGDHRHDTEVKPELLANAGVSPKEVLCILEDRDSMVAKWRELGYRCLQVAEGKF